MVRILNNKQIADMEREESEAKSASEKKSEKFDEGLAGFVRGCWEEAVDAKTDIETGMLKALRQRDGEYEAEKLTAIKEVGGSQVFMMITDTKCRHAEAWLREIIFPAGEKCWAIRPTPLPELPSEVAQAVEQELYRQTFLQGAKVAGETGVPMDAMSLANTIKPLLPDVKEKTKRLIIEKAKKIAEAMQQKIDDQLTEGSYYKAIDDCIPDIVTVKGGFIKGPIHKKVKVRKTKIDRLAGKYSIGVEERVIPCFERVSPFDIYPQPDSSGIDDGWLIEKLSFRPKALYNMIGTPGVREDAVREIIDQYKTGGLREWTKIDTERAEAENKETDSVNSSDKVDCLLWWGDILGSQLKEWGDELGKELDDEKLYPIAAWVIDKKVIKAALNDDVLGRKPYAKASFKEVSDSFWGKGIPELIEDVQSVCNAVARAIVNNVGIASGPQIEINVERLDDGESKAIWPFKVWSTTNDMMATGKAIEFYQPQMVVEKLINVYTTFSRIADEHSGVPAYAHGGEQVGGAGNTASGLSMLMSSAARGIKAVVKNIDSYIIEPTISKIYDWNLSTETDMELVCDNQIVPLGSSAVLIKESEAMRRMEFLQLVNNPVDVQIMGMKGRRDLLFEVAKGFNLEKTIPDEPEQPLQPMQPPGMGGGGETPMGPGTAPIPGQNPGPQQLDAAGNPVVGQDTRQFNITGMKPEVGSGIHVTQK